MISKFTLAKRKTDMLLSVIKGKDGKFIIVDSSEEFLERFGYTMDFLEGKELKNLLVGDSLEALNDVESGDSVFDICGALPMVPKFEMVSSTGEHKLIKVKVFRSVNEDDSSGERYEIVLRFFAVSERFLIYKKHTSISSVFEDTDLLGIMPSTVTRNDIDSVLKFARAERESDIVLACFSPSVAHSFIPMYREELAISLNRCIRSGDCLGYLENGMVLLFLFGCKPIFAQEAVQRLYTQVNNHMINEKSVDVAVSYLTSIDYSSADDVIRILTSSVERVKDVKGDKIIMC